MRAIACKACTEGNFCVRGASSPQPCVRERIRSLRSALLSPRTFCAFPRASICSPTLTIRLNLHLRMQPKGTHQNTSLGSMTSRDQCIPCHAGTYCGIGSASETLCAPGTCQPDAEQETCRNCEPGKFQSVAGSTDCMDCTKGHFCPEGSSLPVPCPGGTYSDQSGLWAKDQCFRCLAGSFCTPGSLWPQPCSQGSYAPEGRQECIECEPGKYQATAGASQCEVCGAGNYSANILSCLPCSVGEYCVAGASVGKPCELAGTTTRTAGAASPADCVCRAGRFLQVLADGNRSCTFCPHGTDCAAPGVELSTLPLQNGFWRSYNESVMVRACIA